MQLSEGFLYHVYNQANNKEIIFLDDEDYSYFLNRVKAWVSVKSDILAYCLMPNHFHFLIHCNSLSVEIVNVGSLKLSQLSNGFRLVQSQYAQYFNKKYLRSGSVFRPKIKWKVLNDSNADHATNCFNYIHQNPAKAGLTAKRGGVWRYSSLVEYCSQEEHFLVSQKLAKEFIRVDWANIIPV